MTHWAAPQPACSRHPDPETLESFVCRVCGAWRVRNPLQYDCLECEELLDPGQLVTSARVGELLVTLHRDCWAKRMGIDIDADPVRAYLAWAKDTGWPESES